MPELDAFDVATFNSVTCTKLLKSVIKYSMISIT